MQVLGYDPFPPGGFEAEGVRLATLEDALENCDAVSLHCPPAEWPIINGDRLARMRRGVTVINTARAELVDDGAMLAALESGQVAAYATDVFHCEPPQMSALLTHERVIATPHAGGLTEESVERATRAAVENLLRVLEEKEP